MKHKKIKRMIHPMWHAKKYRTHRKNIKRFCRWWLRGGKVE